MSDLNWLHIAETYQKSTDRELEYRDDCMPSFFPLVFAFGYAQHVGKV
jgi:hypothetical protein